MGRVGFTNQIRLIYRFPSILNLNQENIQYKLQQLKLLGYTDPVHMIEQQASIVSLSIENVQNKLTKLGLLGFANPISLSERYPVVLSLSSENINRRVQLFTRLIHIFDSPIDPTELMEQETALFGTKIDKLLVLTRIARDSIQTAAEIDKKLIHDILFANLEDVLLALEYIGEVQDTSHPDYTIQNLVRISKDIKKQQLPKDTKRRQIADSTYLDTKTKRRYFKGYPMKTNEQN